MVRSHPHPPMSKGEKEESYLESLKEYQDKMYVPGYYTGNKVHPALKAKTKAGGYLMIISGAVILFFSLFSSFSSFSFENIGGFVFMALALLLILAGLKFIKSRQYDPAGTAGKGQWFPPKADPLK
jgi:hypothetical protein